MSANSSDMNNSEENSGKVIDLGRIAGRLWKKKRVFYKVWPIVFILSCIWIFPEPRYYTCDVSIAPESSDPSVSGSSLSSIASSFGVNIGNMGNQDAIYPMLYPDLFESPEFIVSLFNIKVRTQDNSVNTDYYTYLRKYQKQNFLTKPFKQFMFWTRGLFKKKGAPASDTPAGINPFHMSEFEYMAYQSVMMKITCSYDKKTEVVTINVKDQDPLVCATLADSVMHRLQTFIIQYRTSKARLDVSYYQHLVDSTRQEYNKCANEYARFCDSHRDAMLEVSNQRRDELETDMSVKLNAYTAMQTQLQAMEAKVQEHTPAFTTLKSATVPIKPAGPKRMIFIVGMLILATIITAVWQIRDILLGRPEKPETSESPEKLDDSDDSEGLNDPDED